jgi:hypothetical protein
MDKPKRKRIISQVNKDIVIKEVPFDDKTYTANSATENAKKIHVFDETLNIEIWIDKHYHDRVYHGSDDGTKRDGIEYKNIEPLLIKSFKHLIYYSLKHKNFVFINHPRNKVGIIRLVLKELIDTCLFLNVVVEYHFVDLKTIEVTIVTALLIENFNMSEGQFGIEFEGNYSTLIQCKSKNIGLVDSFDF